MRLNLKDMYKNQIGRETAAGDVEEEQLKLQLEMDKEYARLHQDEMKQRLNPDSWDCPSCGKRQLTSNFCPDCGCRRPD